MHPALSPHRVDCAWYREFGPYVFSQRTRKTAVSFSSDGTLVSYVTLTANDYHPELSGPGLSPEDDMVTLPNLPYITAVATAGGSEMDLLRVGTSTGERGGGGGQHGSGGAVHGL